MKQKKNSNSIEIPQTIKFKFLFSNYSKLLKKTVVLPIQLMSRICSISEGGGSNFWDKNHLTFITFLYEYLVLCYHTYSCTEAKQKRSESAFSTPTLLPWLPLCALHPLMPESVPCLA